MSVNFVSLERVCGIVPTRKKFEENDKLRNSVRSPTSLGIVPAKLLSQKVVFTKCGHKRYNRSDEPYLCHYKRKNCVNLRWECLKLIFTKQRRTQPNVVRPVSRPMKVEIDPPMLHRSLSISTTEPNALHLSDGVRPNDGAVRQLKDG